MAKMIEVLAGESGFDGLSVVKAEMLSDQLAILRQTPTWSNLFAGDVVEVQFRNDKQGDDGVPAGIVNVVSQRYAKRETLLFDKEEDIAKLTGIMFLCGAHAEVTFPCDGGIPGYMAVGYDGPLNPQMIAEAIGINQSDVVPDPEQFTFMLKKESPLPVPTTNKSKKKSGKI